MSGASDPPPQVSVVIPAYNAATTIGRAIESALRQTVRPGEVIVVDDGSTDGLADIVERTYGSAVVLVRQPQGGVSTARNTGIDRAAGSVLAFLDADDYWEPDKLERQLPVLRGHPEVGLVAGRYYDEGNGRRVVSSRLPSTLCDRVLSPAGAEAFSIAALLWTTTLLIRREVLGSLRFDAGLRTGEDRDLWFRLLQRTSAYVVSDCVATGVGSPQSLTRSNAAVDCDNMLKVVEQHAGAIGPIATRQWRAFLLFRRSQHADTRARSFAWVVKSFVTWPFAWTFVPAQPRGPLPRLRRLVVLAIRPAAGQSPRHKR